MSQVDSTSLLHSLDHELRSPLSNIAALAELIVVSNSVDDQAKEDAHTIHVLSSQLIKTTESIIELVRVQNVQPVVAPNRVDYLFREACSRLPADKFVDWEVQPDTLSIQVDGTLITQVIQVLSEHMITIIQDSSLRLSAFVECGEVIISIGSAPQDAKPIDLPIVFTKGLLGLNFIICHRLISLHHGRLWVAGIENEDLSVVFAIPIDYCNPAGDK